jgi:hypothetical protein
MRPIRHRNGAPYNGAVNPYYVNAGYGTALFIGDPVDIVAGGSNAAAIDVPGAGHFPIGTLPEIEASAAAAIMIGVIVSFAAVPTDLETVHSKASTEGVAMVCDDPDVIFEIQSDGTMAATEMGLNASIIVAAGDATTGLSGVELDSTTEATTAGLELKILRAVNREDNDITTANGRMEVLINLHRLSQGTVGRAGV